MMYNADLVGKCIKVAIAIDVGLAIMYIVLLFHLYLKELSNWIYDEKINKFNFYNMVVFSCASLLIGAFLGIMGYTFYGILW